MFSILPRDTGFNDLMDQSAEAVVHTAEAFRDLMRDYARCDEHVARIRELEHSGDDVMHRTLEKLDKTFITPFDREDIQMLVTRMDDVIDEVDAASKRMTLYHIPEPTPWLVRQADVLLDAAQNVRLAVQRLRDLKNVNGLYQILIQIRRLESLGDDNNHAAVAELYNTTRDAMLAMKLKEIYDRTERAIDRCDDIANIIQAIVLKNA
jgi:predicted phosphate transport protein (TIGR00153 family)